ncbi:MAG: dihydrodipicolinate synthase family protein [Victivallales bacterium]|nr:dihydrodipicolinate synthase family protein [Victivallales bacterium]
MKVTLQGIICALITPLDEQERIDEGAVERLIKHVVSGGIKSVIALGTTGEQATLRDSEKQRFIKALKKVFPDDVSLITGTGDTGTLRAIDNTRMAQDAGADAVIVTPPSYYPFDDEALEEYYEQIAEAVDLPVILYNISRYTGNKLSPELVKKLSSDLRIIGIKDSDRDMDYFHKLLELTRERKHFSVIQGSDRLFAESFAAGAPAGVSVTANIHPELTVELFKRFQCGDIAGVEKLQRRNLELVKIIIRHGCFPVELKAAAAGLGLCRAAATSPFPVLPKDKTEQIVKDIKSIIAGE